MRTPAALTRGVVPGELVMHARLRTNDTSGPPTASTDLGDEVARPRRVRWAAPLHRRRKGYATAKELICIRQLKCVVCDGKIESALARLGSVSCSHCR
jgi:hypothetical protein